MTKWLTKWLSNKTNIIFLHILCWSLIVYVILNYISTLGMGLFLIFLIMINNIIQRIVGMANGIKLTTLTNDDILDLFEKTKSSKKFNDKKYKKK